MIRLNGFSHLWKLAGQLCGQPSPTEIRSHILIFLLFNFLYLQITLLVSIALSYYNTFIIEERFGFNKCSVKTWVKDRIKSSALQYFFSVVINGGMIILISDQENSVFHSLFYSLWFFGSFVSIFVSTMLPTVLIPLFNKLNPLQPSPLSKAIKKLASRVGFPVSEISNSASPGFLSIMQVHFFTLFASNTALINLKIDSFASRLGYAKPLCSSLLKLHTNSLAFTDIDWLYSTFHLMHPTITDRLTALGWKEK